MPPFRTPVSASCSGRGTNRARRAVSSAGSGRLPIRSPAAFAGPQPKHRPAGAKRSCRLGGGTPGSVIAAEYRRRVGGSAGRRAGGPGHLSGTGLQGRCDSSRPGPRLGSGRGSGRRVGAVEDRPVHHRPASAGEERGNVTLTTPTASDWEATFDSISDGVVLLDASGRIRRLNRAARDIL